MSRSLRVASVLVCLAVVLAAVAVALTTSATGSPYLGPRQTEPDIMRIGLTQEPDSMNPFAAVLSASYFTFAHVYDLLVGIGPNLQPVPQLAKDWSVAPDNVTWTFNLFDNVKWHDGTPFTAEDVKFTIEYIQRCKLALFLGYVGNPASGGVYIESVTVTSPTQVVIKTNVPKANMLSLFVFIIPKHIWSSIRCAQASRVSNVPPIGTGLYAFGEWVPGSGGYLQLNLNKEYHMIPDVLARNPDMDFVDTIFMQFYADPLPLFNDFRAGNLDATDSLTTRQFVDLEINLDADPEPDVGKFVYNVIALSEIGFAVASDANINALLAPPNGDRHWLMTNLTTRQAIAMAIDKQTLIDVAYSGLGSVGSSLIPPATPFWHYNVTAEEEYRFDLNAAAALLNDPANDGYDLRESASAPGMKGEGLDPAGTRNQDAFADIDNDGIREVINPSGVLAEGAPQGNENLGTSANEMKFGIWIIDYAIEQQTSADIFIPSLASIGISVQKVIVSEGEMIRVSYAADYDLYMWGWGFDVDPDFGLSVMTTDQILGWQDAWYSNATYDALYLEQQKVVDLKDRQEIVHEMQRMVYRDQPYVVYINPFGTTAVRIDRFTNWGNWTRNPGLGLSGYGNSFLMLQLEPVEGVPNTCPTTPSLTGPTNVFAADEGTFSASATDAEGDPLNWTFDWGDETVTYVETSSGVSQASASHAWAGTGTYAVKVTVDDKLCGQAVESQTLSVTVVPLPEDVGWLVGTVTDAVTDARIGGVLVSVGEQSEATAADGTYNLTLAPGEYAVTASRALYKSAERTITIVAGEETLADFALEAVRGWIAGTVTDKGSGSPMRGVLVEVVSSTGATTPTTTNVQGEYNVTVAPGTYTVRATSSGYRTETRTGVAVEDGRTTRIDFALTAIVAPSGIDALTVGGIGLGAVIAIAIIAALIARRRRKREELPPLTPPPPQP